MNILAIQYHSHRTPGETPGKQPATAAAISQGVEDLIRAAELGIADALADQIRRVFTEAGQAGPAAAARIIVAYVCPIPTHSASDRLHALAHVTLDRLTTTAATAQAHASEIQTIRDWLATPSAGGR